jgi:hypothetical protein
LVVVVPNVMLSLGRGCTGRVAKQALTGSDPDISKSYHHTVFSSTGSSLTTAVRSTCGLGNPEWNLGSGFVLLPLQMRLLGKHSQFKLTNFFVILNIYTGVMFVNL